jgi:hypothetical protein
MPKNLRAPALAGMKSLPQNTFQTAARRHRAIGKNRGYRRGAAGRSGQLEDRQMQTSLLDFKVYAEKEFVNHDDLKELVGAMRRSLTICART